MSALLDSLLAPRQDERADDGLARVRRAAAQAARDGGVPDARAEAFKYSNLRALSQRRFLPGDADARTRALDPADLAAAGVESPRIVFVNGVYRADLSDAEEAGGLTLRILSEDPAAFAALLERERDTDMFGRLNTALAGDGVRVQVAAGAMIERPLHLVYAGAPTAEAVAWHLRVAIELAEGASLCVVEHDLAAQPHANLGNVQVDVAIDARARLDSVRVQAAPDGATLLRRTTARLAGDASLRSHVVEFGGQWTRHVFDVHLGGAGASFESRGVFATHARQHVDTRLSVAHAARDTRCDLAWRGVADGRSRGVFLGAITVEAGADGADARLSNKNLLLSATAEIDTQPVLEIHADEVRAAHGATVGQLDEGALFYLRSRGIPAPEARRLLVSAFCSAVLGALPVERVRTRVEALLSTRLPALETAS